ncbi:ABC transporter substrate-binding protein [Vibrio hannami]|uniref:heme/hemin ABC transporter substrate-binding protein n=1 Tax=Vibrio hannami TaxID=2717094 RepID=UPI00240FD0AE|nr:ABC transporter substrate-binding protein [Vibrio hannami]MDG3087608.1 ABC transporter substrate-binding protein [Vibrio hannami]
MKKITFILPLLLATLSVQAKERIISAGSSVTELIYALGANDQLVAVDSTSKALVTQDELPLVGYHRQLSPEGLLALQPSVIIGSDEMGPEATLSVLKESKIDVVVTSSGDKIEDLYARIDKVAKVTGTEQKAESIKAKARKQIEYLQEQKLSDSPNVMFLLMTSGRPLSVAGADTSIDKIIQLAGGENPASSSFSSYKSISVESIIEMKPEYLLVSQRTWDAMGGAQGIVKKYPLLMATPAGHNGNIVPIPGTALIGGFGLESIKLSGELNQRFSKEFSTN